MFNAPLVREHIPIIVAVTILTAALTGAVSIMTAAYGMRDNAITKVLSVVDRKLDSYVPLSVYYQKAQEKESRDYARYYDLRSRIDQVLLEVRKK